MSNTPSSGSKCTAWKGLGSFTLPPEPTNAVCPYKLQVPPRLILLHTSPFEPHVCARPHIPPLERAYSFLLGLVRFERVVQRCSQWSEEARHVYRHRGEAVCDAPGLDEVPVRVCAGVVFVLGAWGARYLPEVQDEAGDEDRSEAVRGAVSSWHLRGITEIMRRTLP
ncbi:hypothetical protein FKP32DRAFT_486122 [Trametes sanguinea]|nr:hypothetical protein FKP32DRAFT_486122 [Trametes sanguinea]